MKMEQAKNWGLFAKEVCAANGAADNRHLFFCKLHADLSEALNRYLAEEELLYEVCRNPNGKHPYSQCHELCQKFYAAASPNGRCKFRTGEMGGVIIPLADYILSCLSYIGNHLEDAAITKMFGEVFSTPTEECVADIPTMLNRTAKSSRSSVRNVQSISLRPLMMCSRWTPRMGATTAKHLGSTAMVPMSISACGRLDLKRTSRQQIMRRLHIENP